MIVAYTGYFAQLKRYKAMGLCPISVARWSPRWFAINDMHHWDEVKPSQSLVLDFKRKKISEPEYRERYLEELNTEDTQRSISVFDKFKKSVVVVNASKEIYLCYEKPGEFCHRHILAEHLREKWGWDVKEFEL